MCVECSVPVQYMQVYYYCSWSKIVNYKMVTIAVNVKACLLLCVALW